MTKFITKTVEYVFLILLAIIILAMSVSLAETAFSGITAFVVGIVILAFVFFFLFFFRKKICSAFGRISEYLSKIPSWKLALIIGLVSVVTKIFFVFLFNIQTNYSDMEKYRLFAKQLASEGVITQATDYASRVTYTVFFGYLLSPLVKLFGSDFKVFTTAFSILLSIAMVLIYDILKRYCDKGVAFSVVLIYCLSPMGLFQSQILIHENALLFCHILALWIFLKALDNEYIWKQIIGVFVSAAILCIGKSVNAAGCVLAISFGIYAFAKLFENGFSLKKLAKFTCAALALVVCYAGSTLAVDSLATSVIKPDDNTVLKHQWEISLGWPIYLGSNYITSGLWNKEDNTTYFKYEQYQTKEEAQEYQKNIIRERISFYKESPIKIPVHLFNKIKVLWGTQWTGFSYDGGNSTQQFIANSTIGTLIRLFNCVLFFVLYSILFMIKISKRSCKATLPVTPALHCQMAVIGVTTALWLFEVMPKYVSHLHIILFCTLAFSIKSFLSKNDNKKPNETM